MAADLARAFEGCRLAPYFDVTGLPTIGYGHLLHSISALGPSITQDQADGLLEDDLKRAERAVASYISVELSAGQIAALTDFTFNLGRGALHRSTLRMMLNRGDYAGAADEFRKWNRAGGRPVLGLTRRRAAERLLFLS